MNLRENKASSKLEYNPHLLIITGCASLMTFALGWITIVDQSYFLASIFLVVILMMFRSIIYAYNEKPTVNYTTHIINRNDRSKNTLPIVHNDKVIYPDNIPSLITHDKEEPSYPSNVCTKKLAS